VSGDDQPAWSDFARPAIIRALHDAEPAGPPPKAASKGDWYKAARAAYLERRKKGG
jgi:hypothetical protein